jgi:2-polyprenyl-6-methoxyphenol hydroxylase-like FAD-dependent oxidoreductase
MTSLQTDVIVVGAGPTGLALANALRAYGTDVVVLERREEPSAESRAVAVHARSLEVLETIGLAASLAGAGVVVPRAAVRDGDRRLLAIDFTTLPSRFPFVLMVPQSATEAVLLAALRARGVEPLRGHEVSSLGLRAGDDGVTVRTGGPAGGTTVHGRFLVGCDGAHSAVRAALGIGFHGAAYNQSFALADVQMAWPLPRGEVQLFLSPDGLAVVAPLPDERWRVVATVRDGAEPPTRTDLQELLERRGPRRHRARVEEVLWASEFRIAHRIADRFRLGRAFLAGDAAHVHSPAGGQGMNTGLQDAVNLAWKLALAVRGEGGEELLDSYELERRPVAARVVRQTDRLTRMATTRSPLTQHARNVALLAAGRVPAVRRRIARDLSQLSVAYRPAWGRLPGGGRRWSGVVPPADAQGPRLHAVVPQWVAPGADASTPAVDVVPSAGVESAVVLRPDGYVAAATEPEALPELLDDVTAALGADRSD